MEIGLILFERREHPSAEQILARVNARCAEVSKATVYNTLRLFLRKGMVRELIVDPARVVYDPNVAPHHHFYDVESGELTDIPDAEIKVLALPPGTLACCRYHHSHPAAALNRVAAAAAALLL